jgi:type I restriction enzyme S subunit
MRFRVVAPVDTSFLYSSLQTERFIQHLFSGLTGSDLPHVTGTGIAEFVFGLPPCSEQVEIVRRVDELFALADSIEIRYAKAREHVDNLKQSILAKAFRGELVPQDPNDEPADVLLERIREARTTQPPHTSRRKVRNSTLNVATP